MRPFFALDAIASPADLAPSLLPWVLLGVLVVVAVTVALQVFAHRLDQIEALLAQMAAKD